MNDKKDLSFRERTLDEIWEEMSSLEGTELDEFLKGVELDPEALTGTFKKSVTGAIRAKQRERFEAAQKHVRAQKHVAKANVVSFEPNKKREILSMVHRHAAASGDMTIAARNQKLSSNEDIDSLLEAYVRLGIIDTDGNLKE